MKVMHVITGLNTGGAEMMLYRLLSRTDRTLFKPEVVSMTDVGPVGDRIRGLGVPVRALGMRRGVPNPLGVLRLARWIRENPPHAIQTWMYQADLLGGVAARLCGGIPVAWGIHSTNLDPRKVSRLKVLTVRACARSSRLLATRIVCCSESTRNYHQELGYVADKMLVILNGSDLTAYKPDSDAYKSMREELRIRQGQPLVGLVARFDPAKDHHNFVRAAALLHARLPEVNFVLCGDGITWANPQLTGWIDATGIRDSFHLLGRRTDVPRLTAALDVASSASLYGEAWPLTIGEAMACGVPCVVTNVGDQASMVGQTGRVVPPGDPEALADAWYEILAMSWDERTQLGMAARRYAEEHFSLEEAVAKYERLYRELGDIKERSDALVSPIHRSS